jgi:uncharacterized protein (DUF1015 family)
LPESIDEHDEQVYAKAKENFELFKQKGWLVQDNEEYLYIYAQTMDAGLNMVWWGVPEWTII